MKELETVVYREIHCCFCVCVFVLFFFWGGGVVVVFCFVFVGILCVFCFVFVGVFLCYILFACCRCFVGGFFVLFLVLVLIGRGLLL